MMLHKIDPYLARKIIYKKYIVFFSQTRRRIAYHSINRRGKINTTHTPSEIEVTIVPFDGKNDYPTLPRRLDIVVDVAD
jgi:hypothetical protein